MLGDWALESGLRKKAEFWILVCSIHFVFKSDVGEVMGCRV